MALVRPLPSRQHPLDFPGGTSRWVTLRAARVLTAVALATADIGADGSTTWATAVAARARGDDAAAGQDLPPRTALSQPHAPTAGLGPARDSPSALVGAINEVTAYPSHGGPVGPAGTRSPGAHCEDPAASPLAAGST